jgi:hypothetical protein
MSRITIKAQNLAYFQALQSQMECSNPTEALNHLLMDLKRRGYSFLDGMEYIPQPLELTQPVPKVSKTARYKKPSTVKAIAPTPLTELPVLNSAEIDPIIQRMAALLEDF